MFSAEFAHFIKENGWIFHIIGIIVGASILHVALTRTLDFLGERAAKSRLIYDNALIRAVRVPVVYLIWLLAFIVSVSLGLTHTTKVYLISYLLPAKRIGILLIVSWVMMRFIRISADLYIKNKQNNNHEVDQTLVHAVSKLLILSLLIITTLIIMQSLGLPISGLLAFGGLGGAAIAFASKELLSNFFGGLVIYMDRPFSVGDLVRSPDKSIEGTVEFIGWRVTRIRGLDSVPIYVPNGVFLTISVENPSRMLNRRINTKVGVRYNDASKIDEITQQIKQMITKHEEIDARRQIAVNFIEFGPYSLNILVYAFTKTTNFVKFQAVQHDIYVRILKIIADNGAECAFPTQTLFVNSDGNS